MPFLRRYRLADREYLADLFADAEVMRFVGDGRPLDRPSAQAVLDKILSVYETDPSFFIWAVHDEGEYAGHAELKRRKGRSEYELIYMLAKSRWGRGTGGRVVDLLLQEARGRNIPFVVATVHDENAASVAILRRRGFVPDDVLSAEMGCSAYRLEL